MNVGTFGDHRNGAVVILRLHDVDERILGASDRGAQQRRKERNQSDRPRPNRRPRPGNAALYH
jgi:hypothetical protein